LELDRRIARVVLALVGIGVVVPVMIAFVGFATRPFDRNGEHAMGLIENSLGHRYTLDAASLSTTWTFTRDADVVIRFAEGSATLEEATLDAGCYSGTVTRGTILRLADAHGVAFASPDFDASCEALP